METKAIWKITGLLVKPKQEMLLTNMGMLKNLTNLTSERNQVLLCFNRLPYLETSAATGHNVGLAINILLDKVMTRMENAIDNPMFPARQLKLPQAPSPTSQSQCICNTL